MYRDSRSREAYDYERLLKRHKEERMRGDRYEGGRDSRYDGQPEYTSICLNGLHPKVPMHILKDEIYKQFDRFGELNVRVVNNPDNRIAYVNYFNPDHARQAKHDRKDLVLFDYPVHIEAVYNRRRSPSPNGYTKHGYNRGSPGSLQTSLDERDPYFENSDRYYSQGKREYKDHKFPYHLNHVPPEDDSNANRTLFVGNIDVNITEVDLRGIFERYGIIEEIDIKRPQKGQGNAYAFIKYFNVDMAHRAKVDMSGRYIGRYQCKIGYGKPTATNCLWIGGLGPWVRAEVLEQEFDRFGVIHRIEWPHGKGYAYVLFDSVDAAAAANVAMRGMALGGPEHRIRVDFADESHMPSFSKSRKQSLEVEKDKRPNEWSTKDEYKFSDGFDKEPRERSSRDSIQYGDYRTSDAEKERYQRDEDKSSVTSDRRRQSGKSHDDERSHRAYASVDHVQNNRERDPEKDGIFDSPQIKRKRTASPSDRSSVRSKSERDHRLSENENDKRLTSSASMSPPVSVEQATSIEELSKGLQVVWCGALVLKNSAFAARLHLVSGDVHLVDTLMRDATSTEMPMLKITQRLRLDPPKLEEVGRRVQTSGPNGHAVLLALPGASDAVEEANSGVQQRPLRNLISYLKTKEAAGVISLPPIPSKDKDNIGVLHAFPPCEFGKEFLLKRSPQMILDFSKDDHLVILVVRGAV